MKIVWLSGFAGAGKDTVASILVKKYDYYRVAFADHLKDFTSELYGFDRTLCDTDEGKKTVVHDGKTVRDLLIKESADAKTKNIHVFAEQALLTMLESKKDLIVISDWRYPHEYEYITGLLGAAATHKTIRITRPNLPSLQIPSEHALDSWKFDHELINTKLRELEKDIVTYLKNQ
jgi:hypothetical protein